MPEFELDLTNVESEVVGGVTVIKSAEVTAVSLGGMSVEQAATNFRRWGQTLRDHEGNTAEEMRQAGDGIRAVAAQIAEEADRG